MSETKTVTITFPDPCVIESQFYAKGTRSVPEAVARFAVKEGKATFPTQTTPVKAPPPPPPVSEEPKRRGKQMTAADAESANAALVAKVEKLKGALPKECPFLERLQAAGIDTYETLVASRATLKDDFNVEELAQLQQFLINAVS